jgi:hypothetical protein
VILISLCQLILRIVFLGDNYLYIGHNLHKSLVHLSPWASSEAWLSTEVLHSDFGLLEVPIGVSPSLDMPSFPSCWVSLVATYLALLSFCLMHLDSPVTTRWSLLTPDAVCL